MIMIFNLSTASKLLLACGILIMLMAVVVSSGCVTMGKTAFKTIDDMTGTPYPTPTPTAQTTKIPDRVTVPAAVASIVPIPTEKESDYMARTNGFYQGDLYKFYRANVSNTYQNLMIYTTVYGHKLVKNYSTWSDEWATYFDEVPRPGYQYLFVYVVVWVDMDAGGDDCRPYGFDQDHWRVQYNGRTYEPVKYYQPNWRIKELENVPNYNKVDWIKPYGYLLRYDSEKGWIADPLGWIKGGRSNAWDGYVVYEVPASALSEDIKVIGRFENLGGWAWWKLK